MSQLPTKQTRKKYGLSLYEWLQIMERQEGLCPICENYLTRPVIDHEHVKGWKKLPPEEKKKYVRGLTCWVCNNRILTRGVNSHRLKNALKYLEEYESERRKV